MNFLLKILWYVFNFDGLLIHWPLGLSWMVTYQAMKSTARLFCLFTKQNHMLCLISKQNVFTFDQGITSHSRNMTKKWWTHVKVRVTTGRSTLYLSCLISTQNVFTFDHGITPHSRNMTKKWWRHDHNKKGNYRALNTISSMFDFYTGFRICFFFFIWQQSNLHSRNTTKRCWPHPQ